METKSRKKNLNNSYSRSGVGQGFKKLQPWEGQDFKLYRNLWVQSCVRGGVGGTLQLITRNHTARKEGGETFKKSLPKARIHLKNNGRKQLNDLDTLEHSMGGDICLRHKDPGRSGETRKPVQDRGLIH